MSAEDAVQIYADSIEALRGGDRITPVERLRHETFALLTGVRPVESAEDVEAALAALRPALARPLAAALALLDFGGERGALEVGWALQVLATELGECEAEPSEPMLALALHDLAFSLLADCLCRGRLEPLPRLGAVAIPGRFEHQSTPIFQASNLRHPNAFRRGAERAYTSWSQWLSANELTASLSHVRDRGYYGAACAEAELLAALAFAQRHGERTFCASVGAEGPAERRLRAHLRDASAAGAIAMLLGLGEGGVEETLNQLYSNLTCPGPFGASHGRLIVPD